MRFKYMWVFVFIGIGLWHVDVYADSTFRCHKMIISVGDYTSKVLEKCGEPDHRETWEKVVETEVYEEAYDRHELYDNENHRRLYKPQIIKQVVKFERWTYNFGPQQFIRYLEFKDGVLDKIKTGDKGTLK